MIDLDFEPKDFALEIAGTKLEFPERENPNEPPDPLEPLPPLPAFFIPAIPNFDTFQIESHNAGSVTEEAYYDFMVKTADEAFWSITEGNLCSFTDGYYRYSFIISDTPKPDQTGWSLLRTNFIEAIYV